MELSAWAILRTLSGLLIWNINQFSKGSETKNEKNYIGKRLVMVLGKTL